jgi:hypothetical protein
MNHFRTIVRTAPSDNKIEHKNSVFTIGSCFADAIGGRLNNSKFRVLSNPFGVAYNPISIHKAVLYALKNEMPLDHTFLTRHDLHFNYDFHSSLWAADKRSLTELLGNAIGTSHYFLQSATHMLITYGTAWAYSRNDSGEMVNNCHKIAAAEFTKTLLSEKEIVDSFNRLFKEVKKFNPALKFIVTLSPVRHVKDTLELNSVSKAVLRSACHTIAHTLRDVEYFPAYEMMMDDLRDYRFYKSDMLHPSEVAEDYIWENFMATYFNAETLKLVHDWNAIQSSLKHKPFHPQSQSHQQFLKTTLKKLDELKTKIDVETEVATIQSQLL